MIIVAAYIIVAIIILIVIVLWRRKKKNRGKCEKGEKDEKDGEWSMRDQVAALEQQQKELGK